MADRAVPEYFLREDLEAAVPAVAGDADPGESLLTWAGSVAQSAAPREIYRNKEGRKTLRFVEAGRPYFLKLHSGIGWREVIKNLLQLRLPVLGARNEYRAVRALERLEVDTLAVVAYTSRGWNPARVRSLLVTEELVGTVSLEDYCADWAASPPTVRIRLGIIAKLADSARRMHGAGINHRDFYLCHFHLDTGRLEREHRGPLGPDRVLCHLIDLHRAQLRQRTPRRWRVKDLAGLYFSAMDCGLSRRDLLRFLRLYTPGGLRPALTEQAGLWRDVTRRAERLYRRHHGREPPGLVDA